jgi:hypothetical protein
MRAPEGIRNTDLAAAAFSFSAISGGTLGFGGSGGRGGVGVIVTALGV